MAREHGLDWTPNIRQEEVICIDSDSSVSDEEASVSQELTTTRGSSALISYAASDRLSSPVPLVQEEQSKTPPPTSSSIRQSDSVRCRTKSRPRTKKPISESECSASRNDQCPICENPNHVRFRRRFGISCCTDCRDFLTRTRPIYKCLRKGNCDLRWDLGELNDSSETCSACKWKIAFKLPGFIHDADVSTNELQLSSSESDTPETFSSQSTMICCICSKPECLRPLPGSDLKYCSNCRKFIENTQRKNLTYECRQTGNCVIRWAPKKSIDCSACRWQKFVNIIGRDTRHKERKPTVQPSDASADVRNEGTQPPPNGGTQPPPNGGTQVRCSVCNSSRYVVTEGPFGEIVCFECLKAIEVELRRYIETKKKEKLRRAPRSSSKKTRKSPKVCEIIN